MKSKLKDLVVQIVSVTIGVFLGFIISNWAETKNNQREIESLKRNMIEEIKNNKERITNVINYHKMLRDSARHYWLEDINKPPGFFDGIKSPTLTSGAFDTGIQTGLMNGFSVNEVQNINDTYTIQTYYNDLKPMMISSFMNLSFDEKDKRLKTFYRILAFSMADLVNYDERLIARYDRLLQKLQSE